MAKTPVDPTLIWQEGDQPEPVSKKHPLVGLEVRVLQNWLENSPALTRFYQNPNGKKTLESAVRLAVFAAHVQELNLQADGLSLLEAQELTRPASCGSER